MRLSVRRRNRTIVFIVFFIILKFKKNVLYYVDNKIKLLDKYVKGPFFKRDIQALKSNYPFCMKLTTNISFSILL